MTENYRWYSDTSGGSEANDGGHAGQAGGYSRSWWASRWLRAMTDWVSPSHLAEGRRYVQQGRVLDLSVEVGRVRARVREEGDVSCDVGIEVKPFSDKEWDQAVKLMASQAVFSAHLLNGEMPRDIEGVFRAAGVDLFPVGRQGVVSECTCGDWTSPCKHVAAAAYLLAERLDDDPSLLLTLRGRTKQQVMASLRAERAERHLGRGEMADGSVEDRGERLDLSDNVALKDFWKMGSEIRGIRIKVRPPEVEAELLRILGRLSFAQDEDLEEELRQIYRQVSKRAVEMAYREADA